MDFLQTDEAKTEKPIPSNAPRWLRYVAMLTGVLAGVGGYLTIRSTNLSNEAIFWSTQATLKQAQASDKWAEYQADSIKAKIVETQAAVTPSVAAATTSFSDQAKDFRTREPVLKQDAAQLEKQRDDDLKGGVERLKQKDLLGYAGMAVQVGIALASVAALVRNPLAFYAAIICGAIGIGMVAYVLMLSWGF